MLFDLGETVFTYGRVDMGGVFAAGARLTYEYLRECVGVRRKLPGFEGYRRVHSRTIRLHYLWSQVVGREFDCMALLDRKLRGEGIELEREQLEQLCWLWYLPLGEAARVEAGTADVLRELQEMGLRLGIVSNTFLPGVVLDRHLRACDLLEFFPVRVYSSETVYRKPDGRIYARALERLGVEAGEAVMVGDKVREDIRGSQRAGLRAVFKRGELNRRKRVWGPVPVIERLGELPDIVRKIKNQK